MKFNLPQPAPNFPIDKTVRVGNVYPCKGGGKTRYWIIVAIREYTVILIGINADGVITSSANYGIHVFQDRPGFGRTLLGHCSGLEALDFDVEWLPALEDNQ